MEQHIAKSFSGSYTAKTDDWELFWEISDLSYEQARAIEKYIKGRKSSAFIRSLKDANPKILLSKLNQDKR
jgi:putative endonuclease